MLPLALRYILLVFQNLYFYLILQKTEREKLEKLAHKVSFCLRLCRYTSSHENFQILATIKWRVPNVALYRTGDTNLNQQGFPNYVITKTFNY